MQPHKTFGSANRQPGGSSPPARNSCLGDDRVTTAQKASETTGQSLRLWRGIMILFGSLHTRTYGACAPCIRPPSPPTMAVLWLQQVMSHDSTSVTSTPSAHERSHVCRWLIQSMADNGVHAHVHGVHAHVHAGGSYSQWQTMGCGAPMVATDVHIAKGQSSKLQPKALAAEGKDLGSAARQAALLTHSMMAHSMMGPQRSSR